MCCVYIRICTHVCRNKNTLPSELFALCAVPVCIMRRYNWKLHKWSKHKMSLYFFTPVVGITLKITPTKELGGYLGI